VVVGARCAGAATAILMARAGLRVMVVDRTHPSRDTLSSHALMRGGVLQLSRWGLLQRIVDAGTPPVTATTAARTEHGRAASGTAPRSSASFTVFTDRTRHPRRGAEFYRDRTLSLLSGSPRCVR
jgi:2-polyprenyl-6-methoxyphenol hydroxylase-like FAD-dependent oxidoreductase